MPDTKDTREEKGTGKEAQRREREIEAELAEREAAEREEDDGE